MQSNRHLLFLDIETASCAPAFEQMENTWQALWVEKSTKAGLTVQEPAQTYVQRAGVMAEFSRIICISLGHLQEGETCTLRVESFYDEDEKEILKHFTQEVHRMDALFTSWHFAGHNIREFDIPFICRRLIIQGIPIPPGMDFQKRKPWEVQMEDSLHYWRFGDYKHYTSLNLLAHVLQVPVDKESLNGSQVGPLYWSVTDGDMRNENLKQIVQYCEKDVITSANVHLRLTGRPILQSVNILQKAWAIY